MCGLEEKRSLNEPAVSAGTVGIWENPDRSEELGAQKVDGIISKVQSVRQSVQISLQSMMNLGRVYFPT
jgi:hypothetical protein